MMACVTPFITEHMYLNLRRGIDPSDTVHYANSIHFLRIPEFNEELLNDKVETTVQRMQGVIDLGRLIREQRAISMKKPLKKVVIIEREEQALNELKEVENYIKEELNALAVVVDLNEEEFVHYTCTPNHKELGQALGKLYNKEFTAALGKLTKDDMLGFTKTGSVQVNGVEVKEGMINVGRVFNDKYAKDASLATGTSATTCLFYDITQDENLMKMGIAREVTNKIQKQRKERGVQIEDDIEVFLDVTFGPKDGVLMQAVRDNLEQIKQTVKKPIFLRARPADYTVVGWDEQVYPEEKKKHPHAHQHEQLRKEETKGSGEAHAPKNPAAHHEKKDEHVEPEEKLRIEVCYASVLLNEEKLRKQFEEYNTEKENFVDELKKTLKAFDYEIMKGKVRAQGGKLNLTLNGKEVNLKEGEDFYFGAAGMQ